MTETTVTERAVGGGSFLLNETAPEGVFTPEDFSDEQRQIAQTTHDFAEREILVRATEIENKQFDVTRALLRKAGDLGLLSVDIAEQYGGLEMDKVTSALIADRISVLGSFSVVFGAHVGIGTLPLVWYGTGQQKQRYLPLLATGQWLAAYALSESSSGSDAMNIRTHAKLSPDGKRYVLNGEKMWISNAGMADLFTVFAKIDGDKFSAFLIEAGTPGLSVGAEEHKLGIRGSSTCPLVLADCSVPVENLLGIAGEGHRIAFNVLNVGRYKLGASAIGAARYALRNGLSFGKQRMAFGKPITEFGLVQEKIADCAAGIYAAEATVYRTVGAIDAELSSLGKDSPNLAREVQRKIEQYAVECSILKVWCSEMLEMVVDHMLQLHGGYGYVEEYPAERSYRDSRINTIFEGTNEINRLIISGHILKRALAGRLPLLPAIKKLMEEVVNGRAAVPRTGPEVAEERRLLANSKKLALLCAGAASEKYGADLADQQQVMGGLADIIAEIYVFESSLLRAEKIAALKPIAATLSSYHAARAFRIIANSAETVLGAVSAGDSLRLHMAIFRRLVKHEPANTVELGRQIAGHVTAAGRFVL